MAATTGNTTPIFIGSANLTPVRITGSNSTLDGSVTTNLFTVVTGAPDGTRVDGIRFRNSPPYQVGTASTAMVHRVFLNNRADLGINSSNIRLVGEIATPTSGVRAVSSATLATSIFNFDQAIILSGSQSLLVGQSQYAGPQDIFDAHAFAGNY